MRLLICHVLCRCLQSLFWVHYYCHAWDALTSYVNNKFWEQLWCILPLRFQQGIFVAQLTLIPIRRCILKGTNMIIVSLWIHKLDIGVGMRLTLVPSSIPGYTTTMVCLSFWTEHFLDPTVLEIFSILSIRHMFGRRIQLLCQASKTAMCYASTAREAERLQIFLRILMQKQE